MIEISVRNVVRGGSLGAGMRLDEVVEKIGPTTTPNSSPWISCGHIVCQAKGCRHCRC